MSTTIQAPAGVESKELLALRCYGPRIRKPVFSVLRQLDLEPADSAMIPAEWDDQQVVAAVRDRQADVLLCPYNTLRLQDGSTTNGLVLLQKIRKQCPQLAGLPTLMPVSLFSAVSFDREWRKGTPEGPVDDALRDDVLVIPEQELKDQAAVIERVRQHVARV